MEYIDWMSCEGKTIKGISVTDRWQETHIVFDDGTALLIEGAPVKPGYVAEESKEQLDKESWVQKFFGGRI